MPPVRGFSPTKVCGPGVLLAAEESNLELLCLKAAGRQLRKRALSLSRLDHARLGG
jgi:hypothetical protein